MCVCLFLFLAFTHTNPSTNPNPHSTTTTTTRTHRYISVYAPDVGRFLFKRLFGPARVNSFLNGGSVFDVGAVLRSLWE